MNATQIAAAFHFGKEISAITECKFGHINSTFFVDCEGERFVLQRINKKIFRDPPRLMENLVSVTDHIRKKLALSGGDVQNGAMKFVKSGDRFYYVDDEGEYWRAYRFVDGNCYQCCDTSDLFARVGAAFGNFQNQLADYPAKTLHETIPNFHYTPKHYEAFEAAVTADACGRVAACAEEIAFIRKRKDACSFIVDGLSDGRFPLRVTHNDTKLNNVIMNKETGEGLCVIDLDTVMPGSLLYDFGDAIRFGASGAAEDETDPQQVFVRMDMFDAFTKGFVTSLGASITESELLALPESARVLTLETAIRFLTDHLQGDTYFRIHRAGHNLDRARNQLMLVADLEKKMPQMTETVKKYLH